MALDNPLASTDNVWREDDMDRCLSDDLNDIESAIDSLETAVAGKANTNHTHTGYADAEHTHTGYAATTHTHDGYADAEHTHTGYATTSHTHSNYAATEHTHTGYAATTHTHDDYADADHGHIVYSSTSSASAYKLIYVSTTGNDNNDGFTQANAMATVKGAVKKYADIYKNLDIRLADGTYTENIGTIATDFCNLSIRSVSADKDAVTVNMTSSLEFSVTTARMYNMTLNVTVTGVRPICVQGGSLYMYGVRLNVPEASGSSCVNVYNGSNAFLMDCVLNAGTGTNGGGCVYGNQAQLIKAINCTSERTVGIGFYAHNGTDIIYTDTVTATLMTKETSYGKCTLRTSSAETKLWSGAVWMTNAHTVTPAKNLSDCANGWLLVWSDYDVDNSVAVDDDIVTTVIPKRTPSGGEWNGGVFLCDVPRYIGSDTSDLTTEARIMKKLVVYNNKITGSAANALSNRNDVVLRAVYEI